jgi:hypothetical protein
MMQRNSKSSCKLLALAACLCVALAASGAQAAANPTANKPCSNPTMLNTVFDESCKNVEAGGDCVGKCVDGYYTPAAKWPEPTASCFPNGT